MAVPNAPEMSKVFDIAKSYQGFRAGYPLSKVEWDYHVEVAEPSRLGQLNPIFGVGKFSQQRARNDTVYGHEIGTTAIYEHRFGGMLGIGLGDRHKRNPYAWILSATACHEPVDVIFEPVRDSVLEERQLWLVDLRKFMRAHKLILRALHNFWKGLDGRTAQMRDGCEAEQGRQ